MPPLNYLHTLVHHIKSNPCNIAITYTTFKYVLKGREINCALERTVHRFFYDFRNLFKSEICRRSFCYFTQLD